MSFTPHLNAPKQLSQEQIDTVKHDFKLAKKYKKTAVSRKANRKEIQFSSESQTH
jgi:hypothetical protein